MRKAERMNLHELRIRRTRLGIEQSDLRAKVAEHQLAISQLKGAEALIIKESMAVEKQIGEAQLADHERHLSNEQRYGKD